MILLLLVVKGTLVLFAAGLLVRALKHTSAAARSAVWTLTFVTLLLLPLFEKALPSWSLETVLPARARVEAAPSAGGTVLAGPEVRASLVPQISMVTPNLGSAEPARPWLLRWDVRQGMLWLWLGGMAGALTILGARVFRLALLTGRSAPADTDVERLARGLALSLGVLRPVSVRVAEALAVPVTWGSLEPVILLPPNAHLWSRDRLRAVLLHELAHVARADWLVCLVGEAGRAMYWPNPLAWMALRSARMEQECAADDTVLRAGTDSAEYATHLYEIALTACQPMPSAGLAAARPSTLRHRVTSILSRRTVRDGLSPVMLAGTVLLVPAIGLPVAGLEPVPGVTQAAREYDLMDLATCGEGDKRLYAIQTLGALRSERAVIALAGLTRDQDARVRRAALGALARIGDGRAVVPVVVAFGDEVPGVRLAAVSMAQMLLASAGSSAEHVVAEALVDRVREDTDPGVRAMAVRELAGFRDGVAVAGILHGLADPHPEVRRQASLAARETQSGDPRLKTAEAPPVCTEPHRERVASPSPVALTRSA